MLWVLIRGASQWQVFAKGGNLCRHEFATLVLKPFKIGTTLKGKNLLPLGANLFLKSSPQREEKQIYSCHSYFPWQYFEFPDCLRSVIRDSFIKCKVIHYCYLLKVFVAVKLRQHNPSPIQIWRPLFLIQMHSDEMVTKHFISTVVHTLSNTSFIQLFFMVKV